MPHRSTRVVVVALAALAATGVAPPPDDVELEVGTSYARTRYVTVGACGGPSWAYRAHDARLQATLRAPVLPPLHAASEANVGVGISDVAERLDIGAPARAEDLGVWRGSGVVAGRAGAPIGIAGVELGPALLFGGRLAAPSAPFVVPLPQPTGLLVAPSLGAWLGPRALYAFADFNADTALLARPPELVAWRDLIVGAGHVDDAVRVRCGAALPVGPFASLPPSSGLGLLLDARLRVGDALWAGGALRLDGFAQVGATAAVTMEL